MSPMTSTQKKKLLPMSTALQNSEIHGTSVAGHLPMAVSDNDFKRPSRNASTSALSTEGRKDSIDSSASPMISPPRALLVEDNEINLRLLVRYMRKLGVDYVTTVNGLEALNIYRAAPDQFDVILMGMQNFSLSLYSFPSLPRPNPSPEEKESGSNIYMNHLTYKQTSPCQ